MYTNAVYERVNAELERRRKKAESEANARTAEVRVKCPRISEIDQELSGVGMQIFKAAVTGVDIGPIREHNLALNRERVKLLGDMGYPDDYTDAHYTCPVCEDRGTTPEGYMCSCMKELVRTERIRESGMGKLIDKQTFENFDLDWYGKDGHNREIMQKNFNFIYEFARNFANNKNNTILFAGKTGTGKTHLSTAVAGKVIEAGYSVIYDSIQNIISDFERDQFKSGYGEHISASEKYFGCDLLIVDDLGVEFSSPFTVSCIYNLINTRQNKGQTTILSTNLEPSELSKKYEARIYSRIVGDGSIILQFEGRDHRLS